ncbi:MAG: S26 family signal peptidase [Proteobacteria bacterium]|nr:S26 family signal peptidase [Pseudomonadota bacterium]MBU4028471.1 S26 family signal peptidase [Pseudomonadota bacterium]MBU4043633.1 S26 family signal peptidase [Pseudomonadota bacterium]MBU4166890.1 S26 family signal peptidase [Pseudomonadota bacterium]MCG2744410.1 S26 family signal peptidase [Desulfobacteraceae bacterium]
MRFLPNSRLTSLLFRLTRWEKTVAMVVLAALLLGSFLPGRLIVAISDSLDHRLFFMTGFNRDKIKNGDYLVFQGNKEDVEKHAKPMLNKDLDRLIKKVGCAPGEMLTRDTQGQFFCQGVFIGKALKADSLKRPLTQFQFSGIVPEKTFFMIGTNPRSYDSKYFGFVDADKILHKALPLW